MSILNITAPILHDNSIESVEFHSYKPYVTSFNTNDEIRIPINQQDLYILPCASTLYLEGNVVVINRETKTKIDNVHFTNNPALFFFQDIRYELNGVEIDKIKNAGITTTIKSLLSMNENESKTGKSWGWDINGSTSSRSGSFSVSIPLSKVLGFAEDYNKIVMNCKHELVLLRSSTNLNALQLKPGEFVQDVEIKHITWRVPHIKVSDRERINLLKHLENDRAISIVFRNWDLYEYSAIPQTTKHTWSIKTSSQIEKPRFVVIGLQTDRNRHIDKDMSQFDHCNLRDVKVFLNSCYFPYENLNTRFGDNNYVLIYEQYAKFQQSYHGRRAEPLLSFSDFKSKAPLFVIDCSRQNETLKSGPIDVRVDLETDTPFPANTTAYCLILNDSIIEYKPLTNIVRKLS